MADHNFDIHALNEIVVALGGTGGHEYEIDAYNEWATLVGGTGGHEFIINALNEITNMTDAGGPYKFQIDALNAIVDGGGGGTFRIVLSDPTFVYDDLELGDLIGSLSISNAPPDWPPESITYSALTTDGNRIAIDGDLVERGATALNAADHPVLTFQIQATNGVEFITRTLSRDVLATAIDTTPDAFDFVNVTDAALDSPIRSAEITIAGVNAPVPFTMDDGVVSINGDPDVPYTSAPAFLVNGDTVEFGIQSAPANSATVDIAYDIGGITGVWTVTTEALPPDVTAPTIFSLSPADNATDVPIGTNAVLTADEDLQFGATVSIELRDAGGVVQTWTEADIDAGISVLGPALSIVLPTLTVNTGYNIRVAAGSLKDLAGNDFAGITTATVWNFTTEVESLATLGTPIIDLSKYSDFGASDADNLTNETDPLFYLVFDTLVAGDIIRVWDFEDLLSEHTVTADEAVPGALWSLSLLPFEDGPHSLTIQQFRGSEFSEVSAPLNMTINTEVPALVTLTPADNAGSVSATNNFTMLYNMAVYLAPGKFYLRKSSDDSLVEEFDTVADYGTGAGQISTAGPLVTINPTASLVASTSYYVVNDEGTVVSVYGTPAPALTDPGEWNFATTDVAPPQVVGLFPSDDATDVLVTSSLLIELDEEVVFGASVSIQIKKVSDDSVVYEWDETDIGYTLEIGGAGNRFVTADTLTNLPPFTEVYVNWSAGFVEDTSGNAIAALTGSTDWNFETGTRLDPATLAWVNAVVSAGGTVSTTQEDRVDAFIIALKSAGIYAKIDDYHLLGGENVVQQMNIGVTAALRAIDVTSHGGTRSAGGWQGNGTTEYIDTLFNPSTAGGLYLQNSCFMSCYCRSNTTSVGSRWLMGAMAAGVYAGLAPQERDASANQNVPITTTNTTTRGGWIVARSASNAMLCEQDGVSRGSGSNASNGRPNATLIVGATRINGAVARYSADQIASFGFGGYLDSTERAALRAAELAYMTAWGINV